jgi:putative transposase
MKDTGSLSHSRWECKYHVVFIPKYRRKALYKELRQYLGKIFHELAGQRECQIEEGHLCVDHVHMLIAIPPKYSVAQIVGQECDCDCPNVSREATELQWAKLLGEGIPCLDGGAR